MNVNKGAVGFLAKPVDVKTMPQLKGMGLKDVVVLCENIGLKVSAKGKGRVVTQSILPGQSYAKGQILNIELN
jgi:cell division protein FtsI (penicillin-binding protein 3)